MEWQLYELDTGELLRCQPKDESRRMVDTPEWLAELLSDQVVRVQPKPCAGHRQTYVFRSHGSPTVPPSPVGGCGCGDGAAVLARAATWLTA